MITHEFGSRRRRQGEDRANGSIIMSQIGPFYTRVLYAVNNDVVVEDAVLGRHLNASKKASEVAPAAKVQPRRFVLEPGATLHRATRRIRSKMQFAWPADCMATHLLASLPHLNLQNTFRGAAYRTKD